MPQLPLDTSNDEPGCFAPLLALFRSLGGAHAPTESLSPASSPSQDLHAPSPSQLAHKPHAACKHDGFGCNFGPPSTFKLMDVEAGADDLLLPSYSASEETDEATLELLKTKMEKLSGTLRAISLKIHDRPETAFDEVFAHKTLTDYLSTFEGVKVDRGFKKLPTAFRATFKYGKGGKTVGVNSEYDALPAIGHACGHNLIAIAGVGTFLALRQLLLQTKTSGTVILLGTPAEEGGGGKIKLLEAGAYQGMDACVMTHPAGSAGMKKDADRFGYVGPCLAAAHIFVTFTGHTAHASAAPWEGINALDAANLAYSSISSLRQQILPSQRVHGIIVPPEDGWAANIIPDKAGMKYVVRSPTLESLQVLQKRVERCFEAAALATGCTFALSHEPPYADLRQSAPLAEAYQRAMGRAFGYRVGFDRGEAVEGASTDAGNISHVLPFLHPSYPIPTPPNGGNHTPAFTAAAATPAAHVETLRSAVGLAAAAAGVLLGAVEV